MNADEEYVRSLWEHVWVIDFWAGTQCSAQAWSIQLPCRWTSRVGHKPTDLDMWAAAAVFTHERERKIAEVEEEIRLLQSMVILLRGDQTVPIYQRTIARLESAKAELARGMRPPAPQKEK